MTAGTKGQKFQSASTQANRGTMGAEILVRKVDDHIIVRVCHFKRPSRAPRENYREQMNPRRHPPNSTTFASIHEPIRQGPSIIVPALAMLFSSVADAEC